ncbi:MAG: sugar ABC transporter substrate-binding protein [Eubacteriales bacterium]|nr:sugar ABC transporter substrate-binding protein [Eubacteriales bacterium]
MKQLRSLAAILVAAVFGTSLVACQGQGAEKSGKTEIRFSTWDNADTLQFQEKMVEAFNQSQDKIHVSIESYGSNYDTKITTGIGSKDAPDVMYMWNYPKYGEALEPLDTFIEAEGKDYKEDFYDALWIYNRSGDKTLGIPVGYTTHVIYYNKILFQEAGVQVPEGEWTWDELRMAAKKIADPSKKRYGLGLPIKADPYDFEMFAWSNGGSYSDESGSFDPIIASKRTTEPFQLFQDMIAEGSAVSGDSMGEDAFKMGTVAMYINGAWSLQGLKESDVDFGVALLPNFGDQKSVSIVSSSGVSIAKSSEHKDAAWTFIKYWTSPEMNRERLNYELPVLKSVAASEKMTDDVVYGKFYEMLERSNGQIPSSFKVAAWSELSDKIELALEQVLNSNEAISAEHAFSQILK